MADRSQAPAEEVDAEALGDRLRLVARGQQRLTVGAARRLGLGANDLWALEHLFADGPLGPVEIGHRLGMSSAAATVLVDRLEAAGHVERRPHPTDRRRLVVAPTEQAGREAYGAMAGFFADLDAAGADLSPAERAVVARYLDRVVAALRRHGEGKDER